MRLCLPVIVILVLCTICNIPSNAYPSNGETESEGSGEEDTRSVNEILDGGAITDSDHEYDIVHKVVIETVLDDDDDDENDADDEDDEDEDDDNAEDNDDNNDNDDEDKIVIPPYKKYKKWLGWRKHPLYVVILGGFRWDFLDLHEHNFGSFEYLKEHGTLIPHVKPVFPPEDYPVWTSMATGLYPEDHDITGDVMYDLKSHNFFKKGEFKQTRDPSWWESVNPFW